MTYDQVFNNPVYVGTTATNLLGIRNYLPDKATPTASHMVTGTGQPALTTALVAHSTGIKWIEKH